LPVAGGATVGTVSVPAESVDASNNIIYHKGLFEGMLRAIGFEPKSLNEGHAVTFAELAEEDFTGIGISCGGGMFNVCVAYKSVPALTFATSRGGDWIDNNVAHAIGMSPAMVEQHVGAGSQYLWTPRDASGAFLDGAKNYQLHIPPAIPVKNFWSVVAYDADSRSILRNAQAFPSVSSYTNPQINPDGSIDLSFGPLEPAGKNWIQTMPGKGWFTLFRFYGPLEPFFDKTWKPDDIVEVK